MNSDKLWKKIIIIIVVVIFLFGIFAIYKVVNSNQSLIKKSSVLGAQIIVDNGQLLDVREPSEYIEGHANGAINVPLGDILMGNFSKIDEKRSIYIYCRSGVRATKAKAALEKAGFVKVTNIGSLNNWQNQGGKVCKTNKPGC